MGFSTVAASVIVFAGFLFLAGTAANAVFEAQRESGQAERERLERDHLKRNTVLTLNEVSTQGNNRVNIYLNNDGDAVLEVDRIVVLLDGAIGTDQVGQTAVDGNQNVGLWAQGQELYLRIDQQPRPARVYVVTETGVGILVEP